MLVKRTDAKSEDLLNPTGAAWRAAEVSERNMTATTPQENPYVLAKWDGVPYGEVGVLKARGLHNGKEIFFRLTWADDSADDAITDINQFLDSAGVMFPIAADAGLASMGSTGKPVNMWVWRPDWETPKNVSAEGQGTTLRRDDSALGAGAKHARGEWNVVISRTLNGKQAPSGTANLKPGTTTKIGFGVWQGANQERGGIKAFSVDWEDLEIEA